MPKKSNFRVHRRDPQQILAVWQYEFNSPHLTSTQPSRSHRSRQFRIMPLQHGNRSTHLTLFCVPNDPVGKDIGNRY